MKDLCDRAIHLPALTLLDEPGILHRPCGIEHHQNALTVTQLVGGPQVLERHRLSAGHVHIRLDRDVGNSVDAILVDHRLQLDQIDVALEGELRFGLMRLVDDYVDKGPAGVFLMEPGCGEVHVARDGVARFDQNLAENVLGPAALVCRHELRIPVNILNGLAEVVERTATRVGLVTDHQSGPLVVGHRRRSRVRQQVDVDVIATKQERVVTGLPDRTLTFLAGRHPDRFHHLDFPGLCPATARHKQILMI